METTFRRSDIIKTFEICSCRPKPVNNILKEVSGRETGSKNNLRYKSDVTKLKVEQIARIPRHLIIEHNVCYCLFIRSHTNQTVVGVWQRNIPFRVNFRSFGSICKLKFHYSKTCHNKDVSCVPIFGRVTTEGPYYDRVIVSDCLEANVKDHNCLFYVGNFMGSGNVIVLHDLSTEKEEVWEVTPKVYSCARNSFKDYFAIGLEGGYCFLKNFNVTPHTLVRGNVNSLEFNKMGSVLYVGGDKDGLEVVDIRTNPKRSYIYSGHFAKEIKLLSDELSLITMDTNGEMHKIDTRMWRKLFKFEGQEDHLLRRPFNVCEDLDLICATAKDNISRIWSLNSGNLLKSLESKLHSDIFGPAQCCFIVDQRRWFFNIFQGSRLIPFSCSQIIQ